VQPTARPEENDRAKEKAKAKEKGQAKAKETEKGLDLVRARFEENKWATPGILVVALSVRTVSC
jgi:hypothetical protein